MEKKQEIIPIKTPLTRLKIEHGDKISDFLITAQEESKHDRWTTLADYHQGLLELVASGEVDIMMGRWSFPTEMEISHRKELKGR